jgi:hypothetical protein
VKEDGINTQSPTPDNETGPWPTAGKLLDPAMQPCIPGAVHFVNSHKSGERWRVDMGSVTFAKGCTDFYREKVTRGLWGVSEMINKGGDLVKEVAGVGHESRVKTVRFG